MARAAEPNPFCFYVLLSKTEGVQKVLPIGNLSSLEQEMLKACIADLKGNISKVSSIVWYRC